MISAKSLLSFAAGFVTGARFGRRPLEMLRRQGGASGGSSGATPQLGAAGADQAGRRPRDVREVMTAAPIALPATAPVAEAAKMMADNDVGDVIVLETEGEGIRGILTDRDIAVRVAAEARDPGTTKIGDVSTGRVTTIRPTASVDEAVRTMRREDVRRLPVVESGRAIGIVSLGDLAVALEPESTLADISAAPPSD